MDGSNKILIFLGICIIAAGFFIGGGLSDIGDSLNDISNDIANKDDDDDGDYHLVVQDGVIYMYNTYSGETWRKTDKPNSEWEEIENIPNE